jgi:hypothetical protein
MIRIDGKSPIMWTRLKGSIFVIGLLLSVYFLNVLVFQKATLDAESLWKMQKSMVWNSEPSAASLTSIKLNKLLILAYPR